MKYATLFFIATALCSGCLEPAVPSKLQAVSIIADVSDPDLVPPFRTADIAGYYDFEHHPDNAALLRYLEINDRVLNPITELHLETSAETEIANKYDDVMLRRKRIGLFLHSVDTLLAAKARTAVIASSASECYVTIAKELECLANQHVSSALVIVCSDLVENGAENFYRDLSGTRPEALATKLNRLYPLRCDLSFAHVCLVYAPKDRRSDQRFSLIAAAYKKLLEARHARLTITAALNSATYGSFKDNSSFAP